MLNLPLRRPGAGLPAGPAPVPRRRHAAAASTGPRPTWPRSRRLLERSRATGVRRRPRAPAAPGATLEAARRALRRAARDLGRGQGLFDGNPWSLDVSGGFASPLAAELIRGADLIVGWGCALNMWTMRHGAADRPGRDRGAGRRRRRGPRRAPHDRARRRRRRGGDGGRRCSTRWPAAAPAATGPPTSATASRARSAGATSPYEDASTAERIDPRTLSRSRSTTCCPPNAWSRVDSGNFMGYPSMFLSVPDERGFCFTQAFQSIGLGPGHRDRRRAGPAGPAAGRRARRRRRADGRPPSSTPCVRLGLPMVVVVYNDDAYGAEVHHFGPDGHPLDTVRSRQPTSPRSPAASASRPRPCATSPTSPLAGTGWPGRGTARCWSTPRSHRTEAPGGWRRRSAATERTLWWNGRRDPRPHPPAGDRGLVRPTRPALVRSPRARGRACRPAPAPAGSPDRPGPGRRCRGRGSPRLAAGRGLRRARGGDAGPGPGRALVRGDPRRARTPDRGLGGRPHDDQPAPVAADGDPGAAVAAGVRDVPVHQRRGMAALRRTSTAACCG